MTLDISAIRQRIEKADFFDDWEQEGTRIRNSRGTVAVCPTPQNQGTFSCQQIATLLAHAPADLRALCDEVERLDGSARVLLLGLEKMREEYKAALARAEVAEARVIGGVMCCSLVRTNGIHSRECQFRQLADSRDRFHGGSAPSVPNEQSPPKGGK